MVMAPGQGTGFNSVGDYLDANQGTVARENAQINSGVGGEIDSAQNAANDVIGDQRQNYQQDYTGQPRYQDALDKAIAAKTDASALGSEGGVADYFQKHMGDNNTQSHFDAGLLGFDPSKLQARAGNLSSYLDDGLAMANPVIASSGSGSGHQQSPGMSKPKDIPGSVTPGVPIKYPPPPPPKYGPHHPLPGKGHW